MEDLDKLFRTAERNLNDALKHYEEVRDGKPLEFVGLKLQSCIFQFDICSEMIGLVRNQPNGFALSVALKGLILRLFEYDQLIKRHWIPQLLSLAEKRGLKSAKNAIRDLRKTWKCDLAVIQDWSAVRSKAAAHYTKDVASQVALLKNINHSEVLNVAQAFLSYNLNLLVHLQNVGYGHDA